MIDPLALAIGIGLFVSLLFSEVFGLAAGGMVVPGYIALHLNRPLDVLLTLAAGLVTYAIVHGLSRFMLVYGRRRTVMMILVGYLLGGGLRLASATWMGSLASVPELATIGFIIPGLIAIWIDRQGLVETLSSLLIAAVVVRLVLILALGVELEP